MIEKFLNGELEFMITEMRFQFLTKLKTITRDPILPGTAAESFLKFMQNKFRRGYQK